MTATLHSLKPLSSATDRWLVRHAARPDAPLRLYCFPWSGASASAYRQLTASLPETIETVAVQLPGRGERSDEPAMQRLEPLAREVTEAINTELWNHGGSFALFGHSFGALLAHDVARRLESIGWVSELVVASGSRAPGCPPHTVLHALGDVELCDAIGRMGGTSPDRLRDQSFIQRVMPLIRTDLTACENFRSTSRVPLSSPLSIWSGDQDWYARPKDVSAWREVAGPAVRERIFHGGHFYTSDPGTLRAGILADLQWANSYRCETASVLQAA